MTQEEFGLLLKKYRLGLCSSEEEKIVEDWYAKLFEFSDFEWKVADKEKFKNQLDEVVLPQIKNLPRSQARVIPMIFRYLAAAVLCVIIVTVYISVKKSHKTNADLFGAPQTVRFQNDIESGKSGATWTVNNNKQYILENNKNLYTNLGESKDGELILDSNNNLSKGFFDNMISTKKGQQYKITLSDGTRIWLNASSSIRFKMPFEQNRREVFVTGEAYFEVFHDNSKPFYVISDDDTVSVLGTHFNINAYKDEPNYTATLLEGKVKYVTNRSLDSNDYILKEGEQIVKTKNTVAKVTVEDASNIIAWKDGYFHFVNEDIHEVMRQLSRWYDIQVYYENESYKERFYGDLRKDAPLSSILSVLEKSGVRFLIKDRNVTVLKNYN